MSRPDSFLDKLARYLSVSAVSDPERGGCVGVKVGPLMTVRSPLGVRDRYRVYWMSWDGYCRVVCEWKEDKA